MRAAAELDRTGPSAVAAGRLAHRDDAHLVAVFLAEQRHARPTASPRRRAIRRVSTGAFCSTMALARSSTRSISSRVIGLGCEKSKRSRSGATSEPFCAT